MAFAHIKTGDQVVVVSGKEKGKRGKVLRMLTKKDRVVVERINMVKRHVKPSQKHPQGGVVEKEGSIHLSNVRLFCSKCDAPRRVKAVIKDDQKIRACANCGTKFED
jgi:large subunit ribosomal protein L24